MYDTTDSRMFLTTKYIHTEFRRFWNTEIGFTFFYDDNDILLFEYATIFGKLLSPTPQLLNQSSMFLYRNYNHNMP